MWIKGIFLLLFALTIDALQVVMAWVFLGFGSALQAITPVGGFIAGAAAGAAACWSSSGTVIQGIVNAAACTAPGAVFGAAISASGAPLGIGIGMAVDMCIGITMGSGLILALIMCGMFHPKYIWGGSIIKIIPGINVIPGWTGTVILSIIETNKQKGGLLGAAAGVALAIESPSIKNATSAVSGVKNIQSDIQPSYVQKAA